VPFRPPIFPASVPVHDPAPSPASRGRGANLNPTHRFANVELERDPEFYGGAFLDELDSNPTTRFWSDHSRTILTRNQSPDIPFNVSLNPYRGCEHGCAYCYARPSHEYLGFSAGLDFERNIIVKDDAPELLRQQMMKRSWVPEVVTLSGITDPYQPIERKTGLTRRCLEVMAEFRNPIHIITKNSLILRDLDLLQELAGHSCVRVHLSMTTLDPELSRVMEPRAAQPSRRLEAIRKLSDAGVPVTVMAAPMIPGLNDHEMPAILQAAADAGAESAGYVMLRLPGAVQPVFVAWLEEHFPDRKEKVLNKIRSVRDGRLNDSNFHTRFTGKGPIAEHLEQLFRLARKRSGLGNPTSKLTTENFRRPEVRTTRPQQLDLF
jgi:DNA repair photolyase